MSIDSHPAPDAPSQRQNHQHVADDLTKAIASYAEQNPDVIEMLRRFNDTQGEYERSLAIMNNARLIVSDSSYGYR